MIRIYPHERVLAFLQSLNGEWVTEEFISKQLYRNKKWSRVHANLKSLIADKKVIRREILVQGEKKSDREHGHFEHCKKIVLYMARVVYLARVLNMEIDFSQEYEVGLEKDEDGKHRIYFRKVPPKEDELELPYHTDEALTSIKNVNDLARHLIASDLVTRLTDEESKEPL